MRHQLYGHEGRIPIICVPLATVAVILGVVTFVKVRPRLKKKAEKTQVKRKRATGPPLGRDVEASRQRSSLNASPIEQTPFKFDRITEMANKSRTI